MLTTQLLIRNLRYDFDISTDIIPPSKQLKLSCEHLNARTMAHQLHLPRKGSVDDDIMSQCLKMLNTSAQWSVLRQGSRVFGLLGKATPFGLSSFTRHDVSRAYALTAEFGCLRLERLSGEEEVLNDQLILPTPFSYEYGIDGLNSSGEMTRAIFGLMPSELEQLVSVLRKGSFPILGFSQVDLRCSISGCTIPGYWPHVILSNMALYGNVASLETFVRIVVASLPQGQLALRFPGLQQVVKQLMTLIATQRRGVLYSREMLELMPPTPLAA